MNNDHGDRPTPPEDAPLERPANVAERFGPKPSRSAKAQRARSSEAESWKKLDRLWSLLVQNETGRDRSGSRNPEDLAAFLTSVEETLRVWFTYTKEGRSPQGNLRTAFEEFRRDAVALASPVPTGARADATSTPSTASERPKPSEQKFTIELGRPAPPPLRPSASASSLAPDEAPASTRSRPLVLEAFAGREAPRHDTVDERAPSGAPDPAVEQPIGPSQTSETEPPRPASRSEDAQLQRLARIQSEHSESFEKASQKTEKALQQIDGAVREIGSRINPLLPLARLGTEFPRVQSTLEGASRELSRLQEASARMESTLSELRTLEERVLTAVRDRDHELLGFRATVERDLRRHMLEQGQRGVAPLVIALHLRFGERADHDGLAIIADLVRALDRLGLPVKLPNSDGGE